MKELRVLVFRDVEVITALVEARRHAGAPLPFGSILGITKSEHAGVSAALRIVSDDGDDTVVAFAAQEIAAALVRYCMDRKVPLPRGSAKSVTLIGDELVLCLDVPQGDARSMIGKRLGVSA
ncbi:MAG TPA: hypothetical protein VD995_25655 [Azospirillum sp.]|nr:hypothetical protein [Azospirillum sp.]